jgi:hypothetical protein
MPSLHTYQTTELTPNQMPILIKETSETEAVLLENFLLVCLTYPTTAQHDEGRRYWTQRKMTCLITNRFPKWSALLIRVDQNFLFASPSHQAWQIPGNLSCVPVVRETLSYVAPYAAVPLLCVFLKYIEYFPQRYRKYSARLYRTAHCRRVGTADGGTVVKVLCYKSEGRWFDSRWCQWNFSLT